MIECKPLPAARAAASSPPAADVVSRLLLSLAWAGTGGGLAEGRGGIGGAVGDTSNE